MTIGLVIYSNDPETVWNAFRLGVFALKKGDTVRAFLLGKGVECERIDTEAFKVTDQLAQFAAAGGTVLACGTCLKSRDAEASEMCPISTMADLHTLVSQSDKVLTF